MKKILKNRKWYFRIASASAIILVIVLIAGLFFRPGYYSEPEAIQDNQVSPYLTFVISQFHNKVQLDRAFELELEDDGINDIIARYDWPIENGGVIYSVPQVMFIDKRIRATGLVKFRGIDFVVSVDIEPFVDALGLMHLKVAKIKIGLVRATLAGKMAAKRIYRKIRSERKINPAVEQIAEGLVEKTAFKPAFRIYKKDLRISDIEIVTGKLKVEISPVCAD